MNAQKLLALESIIKSRYENINGIIIIEDGALANENYFNGFGREDAHHVNEPEILQAA